MGITSTCRASSLPRNITIDSIFKEEGELHHAVMKNAKIKSIVDYCEENWFKFNEKRVMYFKNQVFDLGETTNNRLKSTFYKIKSICSKANMCEQVKYMQA